VKDSDIQRAQKKKDWALTPNAWRQLLTWLDQGTDSSGERYLEMRRRLVRYFDRRNCLTPDELADETLNRVARRLEEEGSMIGQTPAHNCYIVARFVFHEYLRRVESHEVSLEELPDERLPLLHAIALDKINEGKAREKVMGCLERCLHGLEQDNYQLISEYYRGEQQVKIENRRALAARLGITVNALSIRACRIRDRLEECIAKCLEG